MSFVKDFSYPEYDDLNFQYKIFKKREFYYNLVPHREIMKSYDEIKKYRDLNCPTGDVQPTEQQIILPNFINPNTSYRGILIMHGVGTGKTMAAIRIAEQFKEQVKKYNTRIIILVPGSTVKENFKNELIDKTGTTYLKNKDLLNLASKEEIKYERKNALYNALQYYRILTYKSFHKKVLGDKIIEKTLVDNKKMKSSYKKNEKGEYEREIVIDKIVNMNNTILIIDEAHNMCGNEYGESLKKIINKSENLRIILLSGTPMTNYADQIIELLNFIRPTNDLIKRDKIFTKEKNYKMKIKENGLEYLKQKANGLVSYYRGSIPYTFAKRIDKGVIPDKMLFTPVIKCYMEKFQYDAYITTLTNYKDTLYKSSLAAANFIFPGLSKDRNELIPLYSTEGITTILSQLIYDGEKIRSLINKELFNGSLSKEEENLFIYESNKKSITGLILNLKYLKTFSTKFYNVIINLNKLYETYDKSNKLISTSCTAFVYSNLVKAGGMELFAETLIQNGYLEYQENMIYDIKNNTIDYKTGLTNFEFKKRKLENFYPATFLLIIGGEEFTEDIPAVKQQIIKDVFNNINNIDGKYIKFILGSRVMNEGVTLKNCKEIHIIDAFYNIPKLEQVIGRVIRMCVHKDVINDNYRDPEVNVYKYVIALKNKLSTDEILYKKAEIKFLTIKEVERALKEISFDCPLLFHSNVFPEDVEKYKNCVYPTIENVKAGKTICPALCDFKPCNLKCDSKELAKLWDEKKSSYKLLDKKDINYDTFNNNMSKYEIDNIKSKIKDLFRFKHVYTYDEILNKIKDSFLEHQSYLFEEYFLDQALEEMMPKSENDFNKFNDTIYDKYNKSGYIIQRNIYYIFQPFDENENMPYYYRKNININYVNNISLENYINQNFDNIKDKDKNNDNDNDNDNDNIIENNNTNYNFDDVLEYYKNKPENFIVGIIDKNINKLNSIEEDLFKIRPSINNKIYTKKRGVGIYSFKGTLCSSYKNKEELINIIKKIPNITTSEINNIKKLSKDNLCIEIKNKLLNLEKYSTTKDNNKFTYVIIPNNHPIYEFPYNLEDRIKYIIKYFSDIVNSNLTKLFEIIKKKDKNDNIFYEIFIKNDKILKNITQELNNKKFILTNNIWTKIIL